MKHKIFGLFGLSVLILIMIMSLTSAVTLAEWSLTTDGSDSILDTNLNAGTFTSSGVTFNEFDVDGANAENWELTNTLDTSKYFEVTISPKTDYTLTITDINFDYSASITTGLPSFELQYSKQTNFDSPAILTTKTDVVGTSQKTSSNSGLSIQVSSGETLTIRWFGYNFNIATNEFRVKDLAILGTVTEVIVPAEDPEEITECELVGDNGNLEVKISDITNKGISDNKFGDDEEWFPLENIEVEIEVENKGDEKIKDIVVGWGLYDVENQDWIIDDEENDFNLGDGDEETLTIKLQLDDIDEFEDGNDYVLYVWATGEDEEFEGDETCVMDSDSIEIIIESDFVVVDNIEVPEVVQCGAEVQVTADVWNIGEDDQDEVSVQIYSKDLGINKMIEVGDIDALEDEKLDALITIPETTSEGWYYLTFYVHDEDGDLYENDYDDESSEFKISIKVEGSCEVKHEAVVSATLESGGEAGEALVVKATITNTGDELASYVLTADSYSEWATSLSIEPGTVVLSAGDSREITITLTVNHDVAGDKLFNLVVTSDSEEIVNQPVSVTITEPASGFSGITGNVFSGEGNTYLWGIAILNIILVIIIIIVAIRVAGR